jgi:iron(III) transport system ATP-binding protein
MVAEPAGLALEGISFSYGTGPRVLDGITLEARPGELLSLLGPSGCGKTTLLRVVAGLERPAAGSVRVAGRVLTDATGEVDLAPQKRGVAMVFQNWALFPHLDVADNIAFGIPKALRADGGLLTETLAMVGLVGFERRRPAELSGGQQQRVALGRAVAQRPDVLLLDEPFSNLDPSLRASVRAEVRELLASLGTTTVLVTHDREEAMLLGDRVALLRDGRVVASGDPVDLYRTPPDRWSAGFLGEVVLLSGDATGGFVSTVIGKLRCTGTPEGKIEVMLRPEQITVRPLGATDRGFDEGSAGAGDRESAVGTVIAVAFHGQLTGYRVAVSGIELAAVAVGVPVANVGDEVFVHGPAEPVVGWPGDLETN